MLSANNKISVVQCSFLLILCRLATIYIYLPAVTAPPANQDIWIVELLSILYIFIMSAPILFISNKCPNLTFTEILEKLLGNLLGKLISLTYVCFFIFLLCLNSCHLVQFIGSAIMPETPFYILLFFLIITCAYIVYKGIETITRCAQLFVPLGLFIIILFTIFNLPQMDFKTFNPILADSKFIDLNKGAFNIASRFYEIILLAMLVPNLKNNKDINKTFILTVLLYTLFLIIITTSTQAVLGVEFTKHAKFPYFLFSRQINLFNYIQRVESINVLNWFLGVFIKASAYCYVSAIALKQIFNTKSYKIFILPILLIMSGIVLKTKISKAVVFSTIVSSKVFPYISLPFIFIVPLVLIPIYFIRKKYF